MRSSLMGVAIAALALAGMLTLSPTAKASEAGLRLQAETAASDMSARKRVAKRARGTSLRVSRLSRRAVQPPNPDRPYYRPAPAFFPFATDRSYF